MDKTCELTGSVNIDALDDAQHEELNLHWRKLAKEMHERTKEFENNSGIAVVSLYKEGKLTNEDLVRMAGVCLTHTQPEGEDVGGALSELLAMLGGDADDGDSDEEVAVDEDAAVEDAD